MFATLERIAALPDDVQTAAFAPLAQTLQRLATDLDKRTQALGEARHAYAKKHAIQLRKH
ncbi:hypothetical protein [Xanthomonas bundabergensis]|uniref:hypothetical protein n=1 Tax=Xanthomonas bundabergensis TaxID=3160842 RepID=UPI0035116A73